MFASQSALVIENARLYRDEQRARSDLEALVDTVPVGVLVFESQTGIPTYVNRETRRISSKLASPEFTPEEVLRILTIRRAGSEDDAFKELPLTTMLRDAEMVRAEEIVISVPDGESVTTLVNATPIRSQDGEVESYVVTLQDMTPLQEVERLKAEFLGTVSHELRAPLSSIKGSAATLAGSWASLDPAELDLFFRIIEQEADRMSSLITDLLDVARIEAGSLSISPVPSEVAVLIDEARGTFRTSGGGNDFRIELPSDLPPVMADRRRIVQVMINLLSNAARYLINVNYSCRFSANYFCRSDSLSV
ncbi:MAG: PAS domain-containing protein [Dehalococcoidia bacterium]|nr:PAS domain-containing protein [Dehalococcoidia bacterium]